MPDHPAAERDDRTYTIDEFAARTGFTSRNIRALQTEGLLHGPRIKGRIGYYDRTHERRLTLISRLQSEGFSRTSIAALIQAWDRGAGLAELLGMGETLPDILRPDQHLRTSLEGFRTRMGDQDWAIAEAVELRLVTIDGDEVEILNPALFDIGREFAHAGFTLRAILEHARQLRETTDTIAEHYIDELRELLRHEAASDADDAEELVTMLLHLSPLVTRSVDAALRQSMSDRLSRVLDELGQDEPT